VRRVAQRAEALGFRDLWVTENTLDHVFCFDPFVILTYAAAITTSIRVGVSVAVLPIHHPILVAHQVATLDYASNGRAILGLGRLEQRRVRPERADHAGESRESGPRSEEVSDLETRVHVGARASGRGEGRALPLVHDRLLQPQRRRRVGSARHAGAGARAAGRSGRAWRRPSPAEPGLPPRRAARSAGGDRR